MFWEDIEEKFNPTRWSHKKLWGVICASLLIKGIISLFVLRWLFA